jgi:hypothetical protein
MEITDTERDQLFKTPKEFTDNELLMLGPNPIKWSRELKSLETKGIFNLDYYSGRLELKYSINHRTRKSLVLLRYCSHCFHTNPEELGGDIFRNEAHIHLYREGYGDRYAMKIADLFPHLTATECQDIGIIMREILSKISVQNPPIVTGTLWNSAQII